MTHAYLHCWYCNELFETVQLTERENFGNISQTKSTCHKCNVSYSWNYKFNDIKLFFIDIEITNNIYLFFDFSENDMVVYSEINNNILNILTCDQSKFISLTIPQIKEKIIKLLPFS